MLSGRGLLRFCVYWQDKINFIKFTSIHRENAKTKPKIFREEKIIFKDKNGRPRSLRKNTQQTKIDHG
jgi:hypothetical protein